MATSTRFLTALVAAAACVGLGAAAPARAAELVVNHPADLPDLDSGDDLCQAIKAETSCTLRAALDVANDEGLEPDLITFDPALSGTTFTPATPLHVAPGTTIHGLGSSGAGAITIDGGGATRVLEVADSDSDVAIRDLRIEGGRVTGDSGGGAAIRNGSHLTLDGVVIEGNDVAELRGAGAGAGVYSPSQEKNVTVSDSVIAGNTITGAEGRPGSGAGIFSAGGLEITGSTVSGNQVLGEGAQGGGIWADVRLRMEDTTVSANTVEGVSAKGAGIFLGTTGSQPSSIVNSTISGNAAPESGGGGAHLGFDTSIVNVTFAANEGGPAAGGADLIADAEAAVTVRNTVFASPGSCGEVSPPGNAIVSAGYNVEVGDTCGATSAGDRRNADPMLGPLAMNPPGQTATHAIGPGSAAADAADPTCGGGLRADQRGFPREWGGPRCDAGAYEARHRSLAAAVAGNGQGGIIASGISCGGDCTESFVEGSEVTLTAVAAAGSKLGAWTGCDQVHGSACEVTMSADRFVTASFEALSVVPPPPPPDDTDPPTPPKTKKKCKRGQKRVKGKCRKVKRKKGKKRKKRKRRR